MNEAIPFLRRCHRTESGTAVIWPFLNVEQRQGALELFLDNNALTRPQWLSELPENLLRDCVVNPWMAIQEQWFSNPCFREEPEARINDWIDNLARYGVKFRTGYGSDQVQLIMKNEKALRRQFSSVIPFVAIMKNLLSQKLSVDESLMRLTEMGQTDIPRFMGAIALTALGVALKKQQSFKFKSDSKPAYSYLSSFLEFQPSKKDESDYMNVPYLRNRAGDLNMWLMLPVLRQLGYSIGNHSTLATGDKALHRVIFRAIPPVMTHNGITSFSVAPDELPKEVFDRVIGVIDNLQPRATSTPGEQLARMKNVFSLAKACTNDQRERYALDKVFSEWWLPGHGLEIEPM
ncbi:MULTISPECIES: hypothetical protein [unclassified Janthinobacterium]|uniref:hypothetical protein n=1 Tax=unclassified Janthinobacterium TaxID=2610881 RepID=UPI00160A4273|nr:MULTISPECIES: hypothetical protein [unclassified Janthinobacterium]MBB5371253.1 hypothetical protein [Janthinobacterium sp. K2C7]MBB5384059.1 hypothetical protein [Janthinobacterium sp. K2Li3]MBB5389481.1 hypothetical protein [Janthinobacterium sp. K2E3]